MLKNFLKVTLRNIRRNSLYSVINISGLSIGIACTILILLWVTDETSYNAFLPKAEKLHQVWVNAEFDGEIQSWNSVPLPTYEEMKQVNAKIVNSCVTGWGAERLLAVDDTRVVKRGYFASKEFLSMFRYPLLIGKHEEVMQDPSSIVISREVAMALFGRIDVIGEFVKVDDSSTLQVTGVLEYVPQNSSFQFDFLIPWKHREAIQQWVVNNKTNWGSMNMSNCSPSLRLLSSLSLILIS